MFSLDYTFFSDLFYIIQTDFYAKGLFYFSGVILFFEILRNQISEVDLLQLIPGFYFFLFFLLFIFLVLSSDFIYRLPIEIDSIKGYGTKTTNKMELNILAKFSFFLFSTILLIVLNTVIPLSLDSFNYSGEKTLENTWSLNEVLLLETILLVILVSISQIPLFFIINFNTQKVINIFSKIWKILIFSITVIAGFLTPTLDGYTQLSFAISTFSFYLLIINFLQKRSFLKLNIFLTFGS
jgi:uncharacterized membrane protein